MYCVCSIELKGNMHMKKLLLVEDLPEKADEINEEIYRHYNDYFIILLDISMSTFDVNIEENRGVPETLAGKRILEGMYLRDIPKKVKVVTMFENFDGKSISQLDKELKDDNPDSYDGFIFFSFKKSDWKKQLTNYIHSII